MEDPNESSFLSRIDLSGAKTYGSHTQGGRTQRLSSKSPATSSGVFTNSGGIIGESSTDISTDEFESNREDIMPCTFKDYSKTRWASGFIILLVLALERFAFYSLAGNMLLFLNQQPFLWLSYNAMTATYVLTGIAFMSSIFGGYIADSLIGRYYTILVGLILYIICYVILTLLAYNKYEISNMCLDPASTKHFNTDMTWINNTSTTTSQELKGLYQERCSWLIYLILTGIGLSVGLVKTNLASFGSEQIRMLGGDAVRVFFNWFYFSINIGGLVAVAGMSYIQQSTQYGFWLGYLIPTCLLGLALLVFALARPIFVIEKPVGSIITSIVYILKDAIRYRFFTRSGYYKQFQNEEIPINERPTCLDMASVKYGGKYAEAAIKDVRVMGNIVTVFFALIPFWVVYFQMQTTFLVQGLHMRLGAKNASTMAGGQEVETFSIPAAWLTLLDIGFILFFIPILDRIIYPFLDRHNIRIKSIERMKIGMALAVFAMIAAGSVESYRLNLINTSNETIVQIIGNTTYYAADMWIFWQIPQYSLIGLSESFASVAGLEFACSWAPHQMRSLITGLFYFFTGISSFLGTGLLNAFHNVWFYDRDNGNINYGHLDYYFFLLAAIQLICLIIFVILVKIGRKKVALRRRPLPPQIGHTDEQ